MIQSEVVVVPDGLHGVVALEVGDLLSEVGLVVVESVGSGAAEFLTHEGHRDARMGADRGIPDEGLPRLLISFLLINIFQQ